ncbi:AraC family transcriptional regulator [Microbaculum sp. A6E488]|uniref:AraC family transcriptional regulator n=1 Tax=Microbaculum marinisediminis TaxID=2931392 RepID=A0AAW5QZJ5_9HYPH|nr:AraC family transcriptional regulator [Microbaculum sp. A6E488]
MELIGAPQTAVPLRAMIGLFERCARELDDRAFGLDVGFEMQRSWGFGLWGRYGALAPTLGSAIARYNRTFRAHASGGKLELIRRGCHWLWRHVRQDLDIPTIQHVDHRIGPMVALAREFLGQTWSPEWAEVSYPRDPEAHVMEDRLQIPVFFGCRGTGIVFRSEDLSARKIRKPADGSKVITLREVVAEAVLSQAPEPARSLSAIVALRLLDGHTDIEGTARMAGLSVRSLQRQLLENGHSYREIVTVARGARAVGLLRETDRPIVEIAMLLGYEDHASFTRAFHRWMQCSPSEFRRRGHRTALA